MNLFSNAFKFTPDGGQIQVRAMLLGNGNKAAVIIKDNGIGIDQSQTEKYLNAFTRWTIPRSKNNYGTGIGLHLSRALMTLLHGTIEVKGNQDGPAHRLS